MMNLAWVVPLFPLCSFVLLLLFGRKWKKASAYVGIAATLLSMLAAIGVLADRLGGTTHEVNWTWMTVGDVTLTAGVSVTALNAWMLAVVAVVSWLVHIYSQGYMAGDERFSTFYAYLGLFTFAMLGLVLSPNLLQAYMFWELVGLGSALLLVVIAVLVARTGTANFALLREMLHNPVAQGQLIAPLTEEGRHWLLGGLLLAFAVKLPAVPLHRWLIRVHVEAPPPVVMLHAGVLLKIAAYGMIRFGIGLFPDEFRTFAGAIAVVGVINVLYGALLALRQSELKHVLAYSSVSHMGVVLVGLGALNEAGIQGAVFQSVAHGLIAALSFLLVGILTERMRATELNRLGGLTKAMPVFSGYLLTAALALLLVADWEPKEGGRYRGEFAYMMLFALLGAMMVASSGDLLTLFVSIELLTVSSYILAGLRKTATASNEAALKYVINGGIATAIMLFGMSYVFGLTGTTNLGDIARRLQETNEPYVLGFAFLLLLIGVSFKLATVPFHMWAPDVYEGAPVPATAFFSVVSKAAGFILLLRLFVTMFAAAPAAGRAVGRCRRMRARNAGDRLDAGACLRCARPIWAFWRFFAVTVQ
ncbi:ADH:ubiquinone oxidoreductase subunit M [Geobacillus stearothermophilus]|nr:ADH:ubiquinone oxidoreductase subunit M [Geobacillus stearothermophilus]